MYENIKSLAITCVIIFVGIFCMISYPAIEYLSTRANLMIPLEFGIAILVIFLSVKLLRKLLKRRDA